MSGQDADEELLQHLGSVLAVPDASEGEGGVVAEVLGHHLFKKASGRKPVLTMLFFNSNLLHSELRTCFDIVMT